MRSIIFLACLLVLACRDDGAPPPEPGAPGAPEVAGTGPEREMIPGFVLRERIARLRGVLIPPEGTARSTVDAVYGTPTVTERPEGKGQADRYPMHSYPLLPPRPGEEFRAVLHVTYREGRVATASVSHISVAKSRAIRPVGTEAHEEQQREIEAEERGVLADLEEVEAAYADRLLKSPWRE